MREANLKPLTLIKLGGSIITDKTQPDTLRPKILTKLIAQIAKASKVSKDQFLIAHGQGSFAHVPAHKYETKKGLFKPESIYGMAVVLDSVGSLNRLVIHECINQNLPAVSWMSAQSVITTNGGQSSSQSWLKVLETYLAKGLLPITCGDVVLDETQGCAIWSGETILGFLARELPKKGFKVTKLIQVGEVAGVLDKAGLVIPELTAKNWSEHQSAVTTETKGFDVTGGMLLKVEESLALARDMGIESWILAGLAPGNLYRALTGGKWLGTKISA